MKWMNLARSTGRAIAFASLAALQACGGGSGGGDNVNPPPVNPPPALMGKVALLAGDVGGAGNLDGARSNATFFGIQALTVDPVGNLMVAEAGNHALRKIASDGTVTTVAGGDMAAAFADGQGSAAKFLDPQFVAADASGNWYVSDNGEYIRKVTPQGMVTTLAAIPADLSCGYSCHAGKPLALDAAGAVYFTASNQLRKLAPNGQMTTLVNAISSQGIPTPAFGFVYMPSSLVVDAQGTIYIADRNQPVVRKVSPSGEMTILAGSEARGPVVDGQGSDARFDELQAITMDASGNLYVLEGNGAIRRITPAGAVSTVRQKTQNFGGRYAYNYVGFARDAAGNFYLSVLGNGDNALSYGHPAILKIDAQGVESVYAGRQGVAGDADGTGSAAQFSGPRSPSFDANGNLVVLDRSTWGSSLHLGESVSLRRIAPDGGTTTLVRTNYDHLMIGSAVDAHGNAYVGGGRRVLVVAPDGTAKPFVDGRADLPEWLMVLAVDGAGSVYAAAGATVPSGSFASRTYGAVYKISSDKTVSLLAGKADVQGFADGAGESARFSSISGGAVDSAGNLYVADPENHRIRKITPAGLVSTVAGQGGAPGYSDGPAADAKFAFPVDVKIDAQGNLYVADRNNAVVRKISPSGMVTTVVGTPGKFGFVHGALPGVIPPPEGIAIKESVIFITTRNGVLKAEL
jgi:sugar lactone lactonase YvrE